MSLEASETFPKKFEKSTEILPFTKYGVSTFEEFKKANEEKRHLEWLKKIGLTIDEIDLYNDNEKGIVEKKHNIESGVLQKRLEDIYKKIKDSQEKPGCSSKDDNDTSDSTCTETLLDKLEKLPSRQYADGHPMSDLKDLEDKLFGHLKNDILPINKRRKILRRLERRKERILSKNNQLNAATVNNLSEKNNTEKRPGSLWDVKELSKTKPKANKRQKIIGPKKQAMYTIKDGKIVRLEPVKEQEYRAVEIVLPINNAEKQLLEGTKMSIDDIRKIERFKDYEPGEPSQVLYLKNIAPSVSQEQLTLLFNQFIMENGGPVDVKLMTGRMRGQAFVTFTNEITSIRAVEEINGTILSGRPIIAQFSRNNSANDNT